VKFVITIALSSFLQFFQVALAKEFTARKFNTAYSHQITDHSNSLKLLSYTDLLPETYAENYYDDYEDKEYRKKSRKKSRKKRRRNNRTRIDSDKYLLSGILGTAIGFGSGHFVQGRKTKAIFFLGTEASLYALMILGGYTGLHTTTPLALLGYVGLRVYEIIDVWTVPVKRNGYYYVNGYDLEKKTDKKVYLLPLITIPT
jgi:hypothetical protein